MQCCKDSAKPCMNNETDDKCFGKSKKKIKFMHVVVIVSE